MTRLGPRRARRAHDNVGEGFGTGRVGLTTDGRGCDGFGVLRGSIYPHQHR